MAETKTNLRQAIGKVHLTGVVSEKAIKPEKDEKTGTEYIGGYITVKTSDVNFVRVNARINKFKKDGTEDGRYKGIETVMNEYQSIADVGEEEATKVSFTADINPYTGSNGNTRVGYRANFFNRYDPRGEYVPKAEFEIEMFISAINPEIVNGEETGRTLVKGWFPTYNGIEPITLVGEGEVASLLFDEYEPGQTAEFFGEVVNNRIEHKREIPMRIGKPKIEITYENKNDLVITGVSEPYDAESENEALRAYDRGTIQLAVQERTTRLEEQKNKASSNTRTSGTSATGARPSGSSRGRSLGF